MTKIFFDEKTKKAIGVNVRTTSSECPSVNLTATKEVIISAGSFGSPKILLQSGIGRKADLAPFGIKQIADLNVGNNYADHVSAVPWLKINPSALSQNVLDIVEQGFVQYIPSRTGPFSTLSSVYTQAFINTTDPNSKYAEVQNTFFRAAKNQQFFSTILSDLGYKDQHIAKILETDLDYEVVLIFLTLSVPKSRGTVKLRSSDPLDPP